MVTHGGRALFQRRGDEVEEGELDEGMIQPAPGGDEEEGGGLDGEREKLEFRAGEPHAALDVEGEDRGGELHGHPREEVDAADDEEGAVREDDAELLAEGEWGGRVTGDW